MSSAGGGPPQVEARLEATARITPEGVAAIAARVGHYYVPRRRYTVASRDNIRIFCEAIGDSDPLYLDSDYAQRGPYGGIIAPPTFLYSIIHPTGMRVGGLPGVHAFHSGNDWRWFRPIMLDDTITGTYRPVKVVAKPSRMGGQSVVVYAEVVFRNQRNEVVARTVGWTIRVERGQAQQRGKYRDLQLKEWSAAELDEIYAAYDRQDEDRRGREPRYWDDVQIGDELPRTVKGPLTMSDVTAWSAAGAIFFLAHEARLTELRRHPAFSFRDPSTGSLEPIARVHEKPDVAVGAGVPAPFDIGAQRNAWMITAIANWMGDHGKLMSLSAEYRRFNLFGDVQWQLGRVTGKRIEAGHHLVDIDAWFENQDGVITTPGHAEVMLPARRSPAVAAAGTVERQRT